MALSDNLGQTTPISETKVINPTADVCISNECMYFNHDTDTCGLEECMFLVPAIVYEYIDRQCIICGDTFHVFIGSQKCICDSCISYIQYAMETAHEEGSD